MWLEQYIDQINWTSGGTFSKGMLFLYWNNSQVSFDKKVSLYVKCEIEMWWWRNNQTKENCIDYFDFLLITGKSHFPWFHLFYSKKDILKLHNYCQAMHYILWDLNSFMIYLSLCAYFSIFKNILLLTLFRSLVII